MDSMGFRSIGKQVAPTSYHSPPPPTTSCSSQKAFRVPYNQCDEPLTDIAAYRDHDFGRSVELFRLPSSNVIQEEYEREMEREEIRCWVIAAEIMRKRSLLAALRGPFPDDLISPSSAFRPRFPAPCGSRAIEERPALSSEERLPGCCNRSDIAGFERIETAAFQRAPEPRFSEIEPSLEAKPGKNQSGEKRKAVTPLEAGASELDLVDLKKKPKEDWSCSTCQVSVRSEQGLYQHLQGRKHKAKEALGTGKNDAIGIMRKRSLLAALRGPLPDNFSLISPSSAFRPRFPAPCGSRAIEERPALSSEERLPGCWNSSDTTGFERIETAAFQRTPEPRFSDVEPSPEAMLGKNQSGAKRKAVTPLEAGASELPLVDMKNKPKEDWTCSTCQVIVTSEQGLYQHLQGRKHKAKEALGTGKSYAIGFFPKKTNA